jgi:hypothetical protein
MASRADILKRRNLGRRLIDGIKERVGSAVGRPADTIELVPLEDSDELQRLFTGRWEQARDDQLNGQRFFLETSEGRKIEELAARVLQAIGDEAMHLFLPEAPYCGAVRLTSAELLGNITRLASLDQDDVLACDSKGNKGLACEYFTDWTAEGSETTYRFLAWC